MGKKKTNNDNLNETKESEAEEVIHDEVIKEEAAEVEEESKPTAVLDITTYAEYKKLQEELNLAKLATKESMEMVKNFKLDIDRIRERSEIANAEAKEKVTIEVAKKLLPIVDDFEKSLPHLKSNSDYKGIKMLFSGLLSVLDSLSVREIEVCAGVLNPEKMDAIMTEPTTRKELEGTVAHVIRKGYYYEPTDKVIRFTQVSVYK